MKPVDEGLDFDSTALVTFFNENKRFSTSKLKEEGTKYLNIYLKMLVKEAIQRSLNEAKENKELGLDFKELEEHLPKPIVNIEHLESVLPQLLLDF